MFDVCYKEVNMVNLVGFVLLKVMLEIEGPLYMLSNSHTLNLIAASIYIYPSNTLQIKK